MGCAARLGILVALATIALLVFGVNGVYEGVKYSHPTTMTFDEFVQRRPEAGWYRITGCQLAILDECHLFREGQKDDLTTVSASYIPTFSSNEKLSFDTEQKKSVSLLVFTKDAQVINAIHEIGARAGDKQEMAKYLSENKNHLFLKRDVEGMLKAGLNSEDSDSKKAIDTAYSNRASDAAILEEGKRPSLGTGIGLTVAGVVLAIGQVLYYLSGVGTRFSRRQ